MTWISKEEFNPDEYYGFVYMITNLKTGMRYIGRKYFSLAAYAKVNGKRKKVRKESDWRDYWSSSDTLKADVKSLGEENFKREILRLCKTRTECAYYETKFIFDYDVLLNDNWYNNWVSCKITRTHAKSFLKEKKASVKKNPNDKKKRTNTQNS